MNTARPIRKLSILDAIKKHSSLKRIKIKKIISCDTFQNGELIERLLDVYLKTGEMFKLQSNLTVPPGAIYVSYSVISHNLDLNYI